MTPDQLAKSGTEHGHQVAFFAYVAVARRYGFDAADHWAETGIVPQGGGPDALPALEWVFAIPNGGARGDNAKSAQIRGAALVAEGVRSGVADIMVPITKRVPNDPNRIYFWCGLFIEMKKPDLKPKTSKSKGGLSDDQIAFKNHSWNNGYGWIVCYSWREAANALRHYLEY